MPRRSPQLGGSGLHSDSLADESGNEEEHNPRVEMAVVALRGLQTPDDREQPNDGEVKGARSC